MVRRWLTRSISPFTDVISPSIVFLLLRLQATLNLQYLSISSRNPATSSGLLIRTSLSTKSENPRCFIRRLCRAGHSTSTWLSVVTREIPLHTNRMMSSLFCRAGLSQLAALFQWCIAKKNIGGYTLETRRRRRRAASAEGARGSRREGAKGVGFLGCPPPQPTRESGERCVMSSPSGARGRAPAANAF